MRLWRRTDEQVVVEEERENELEALFEAGLDKQQAQLLAVKVRAAFGEKVRLDNLLGILLLKCGREADVCDALGGVVSESGVSGVDARLEVEHLLLRGGVRAAVLTSVDSSVANAAESEWDCARASAFLGSASRTSWTNEEWRRLPLLGNALSVASSGCGSSSACTAARAIVRKNCTRR